VEGDHRPTTLKVTSDAGTVTSREAVSLGLIVTELILNALNTPSPTTESIGR
jgi:two-component sensor histidine kinase